MILIIATLWSISVPGLLLHYNYYRSDRNKHLKFRPTYIEIQNKEKIDKIYYTDILKIENHHVAWKYKNAWGDYNYIKVSLNNGLIYTYNCLTRDNISSVAWFKNKGINIEDWEETYPNQSNG